MGREEGGEGRSETGGRGWGRKMEGSETGGAWVGTGLGREDGGEQDGRRTGLGREDGGEQDGRRMGGTGLGREDGREREVHCAWVWTGLGRDEE